MESQSKSYQDLRHGTLFPRAIMLPVHAVGWQYNKLFVLKWQTKMRLCSSDLPRGANMVELVSSCRQRTQTSIAFAPMKNSPSISQKLNRAAQLLIRQIPRSPRPVAASQTTQALSQRSLKQTRRPTRDFPGPLEPHLYLKGCALCHRPLLVSRGCHLGGLAPPFWHPGGPFWHLG